MAFRQIPLSPENLWTLWTSKADNQSTIIHLTKGLFTLQKTSPQGSFEGHSWGRRQVGIPRLLFPPTHLPLLLLPGPAQGHILNSSEIKGPMHEIWRGSWKLARTAMSMEASVDRMEWRDAVPKTEILPHSALCPSPPSSPLFLNDQHVLPHKKQGEGLPW